MEIVSGYDVVIDGTDNYPTRYLVNDACVLLGKPNVYGSIFRFEGQLSVFDSRIGPCYRCLYPEPPPPGLVPSCAEGGVLGILPGVIGLLQATEAIKMILGAGDSMAGRLLLYDALATEFREVKVRKDPDCPLCGDHPTITELVDYEAFCGVAIGEEGSGVAEVDDEVIGPRVLKEWMESGTSLTLIDVREPYELEICQIPGAISIPQGEVLRRIDEIPREGRVVVFCRSGARSQNAIDRLKERGYGNLYNLHGGILAWGEEVDPSVVPY
jgi:adenylyltransferase/sulfurtransferase